MPKAREILQTFAVLALAAACATTADNVGGATGADSAGAAAETGAADATDADPGPDHVAAADGVAADDGDTEAAVPDGQPGDGVVDEYGAPGMPCASKADCKSNICTLTTKGKVCAKICLQAGDCAPDEICTEHDFVFDVVYTCRERWQVLCAPCTSTDACATYDHSSYCIGSATTGWFCGAGCNFNTDCPSNHACQDAKTIDGQTVKQCVPTAGKECGCNEYATTNKLQTSCANGACKGNRSCGPAGLSACSASSPATETCNGQDDDCNGLTDDGAGCQ
ncbi:MAG: hypothetical protein HY902_16110 [Deltaproteobacteria bacterium]|nr:hypothetical protein [Deltaproteobacteria bacterium]